MLPFCQAPRASPPAFCNPYGMQLAASLTQWWTQRGRDLIFSISISSMANAVAGTQYRDVLRIRPNMFWVPILYVGFELSQDGTCHNLGPPLLKRSSALVLCRGSSHRWPLSTPWNPTPGAQMPRPEMRKWLRPAHPQRIDHLSKNHFGYSFPLWSVDSCTFIYNSSLQTLPFENLLELTTTRFKHHFCKGLVFANLVYFSSREIWNIIPSFLSMPRDSPRPLWNRGFGGCFVCCDSSREFLSIEPHLWSIFWGNVWTK